MGEEWARERLVTVRCPGVKTRGGPDGVEGQLLGVWPGSSPERKDCSMSHHLDTPLASQNGQLYIDDLYVFEGNHSTVFVMDVNSNITGAYAQPGFPPEARYELKVHFDGADFEALTNRGSFAEPDSAGRQALQLHALTGGQARDDSAAGALVLEGRTGETASEGDTRLWAGRINDSFYIDLSLLGIVNADRKSVV